MPATRRQPGGDALDHQRPPVLRVVRRKARCRRALRKGYPLRGAHVASRPGNSCESEKRRRYRGLRILITNHFLRGRTGSELYVCELATNLLRRGHSPIVYSPQLGHTARELRAATVPVVDNLDAIGSAPDLIHGQHHVETMSALLHFPSTPAVFFCHGWLPFEETPPKHPRILRYVAVDDTCLDRLVSENGIAEERVEVILNSVDLEQFLPRAPLPARPDRKSVV